jgi:polar amino acid transport system substrate-binding protein
MRTNFIMSAIAGILLGLSGAPASAGQVDCGTTPIRVAQYSLGLRYYVEGGQEKGINKDILDELRKRTGCTFVVQEMPFARIWADLNSGNLDISMSGVWSSEREKTLWCAQTITSRWYALLRTESASSVRSAEEFLANKKLIFGVVRGFTHGVGHDKWLAKMRQEGRVEESATIDLLAEKLKKGRVDGMLSLPYVYRKQLPELQMERHVLIQDWALDEKEIVGCMMMTKSRFSETEVSKWKQIIRQMHGDGTLKRIYSRYLPAGEVKKALDF